MENENKRFLAAWGKGYVDAPTAKFISEEEFTPDNGWYQPFINKILALRVYETADCSDASGDLFVSRVW